MRCDVDYLRPTVYVWYCIGGPAPGVAPLRAHVGMYRMATPVFVGDSLAEVSRLSELKPLKPRAARLLRDTVHRLIVVCAKTCSVILIPIRHTFHAFVYAFLCCQKRL